MSNKHVNTANWKLNYQRFKAALISQNMAGIFMSYVAIGT